MTKTLIIRLWLIAGLAGCANAALGAEPYIGYIYPAGSQKGSVVKVNIGGQQLRGAREVYISGKGAQAAVLAYESAAGPLNKTQQDELKRRLSELQTRRANTRVRQNNNAKLDPNAPRIELPDIPELRNLETLTRDQLTKIRDKFLNFNKKTKPPIAETVTLEIKIDADAAPGDRELRLLTANGLTNPIVFQIGQLPEVQESDPDDINPVVQPALQAPIMFNGRIMPGETDSYSLQLKQGQKLVMSAQARHLIPYLADAVPGWFQALLSLSDASGKEVANSDHSGFDPDPVINYTVPSNGTYTLIVRDTLYRGRRDFIYRVVVAENQPVFENTAPTEISQMLSPELPKCKEIEPNDKGQQSQSVKLPNIVSGRIERAGDVDVFKFSGRAGDEIVAEVYARRLGSPMDSLLRLISASGKVIALNDDCKDCAMGLLTHHADSYLTAKLPTSGVYFVQISDAQRHGGDDYNYQLRVSPKQPDFALRIAPSSINVAAGCTVPITIFAFRKDGWQGDIDISLKNAPAGFALNGARIPAGKDCVRMTMSALPRRLRASFQPVAIQLEGKAIIGGKTIVRDVIPAQNMMQAFAYQHLVPAQQLLAMLLAGRNVPTISRSSSGNLRILAGGEVQVAFSISPMPNTPIQVVISEAPAGLTLGDIKTTSIGVTCTIKADPKQTGYSDNLILEVFTDIEREGAKGTNKQHISLGVLPAIPIEVAQAKAIQQ